MNTVNQIEEKSHHTELFRGMSKKRLNPEIAE